MRNKNATIIHPKIITIWKIGFELYTAHGHSQKKKEISNRIVKETTDIQLNKHLSQAYKFQS